jgi:hypothetical protein
MQASSHSVILSMRRIWHLEDRYIASAFVAVRASSFGTEVPLGMMPVVLFWLVALRKHFNHG